jgi:multicomponent K+:H+ antiporter subunit A
MDWQEARRGTGGTQQERNATFMTLALIAALPFLGALLAGFAAPRGRNACAVVCAAATGMALLLVGMLAPAVLQGDVVQTRIEWLPSLGLNVSFRLDGLGLLFAGLILGIGLLIIIYARFYMAERDNFGQFMAFLMLFQGAMLGIVLSENILLLLIFWELTSLSSFLLIGYWRHLPEARQGARMALAVTGAGGLALIGGMLILGDIAGSYELGVILTQKEAIQSSDWYLPALVLILIGAFTKSAQFPFHFWLPHAMAAPTPVSAYLHSATMVKAGIFLLARLWPVLAGTDAWFYAVATTGLITMLIGAVVALFRHDLKALLAYSTVSQLGLITMLLGFGTKAAATVAVFHILNHATFKAALFMAAGMIEHETHTRDIRRLGGLRNLMPITFGIVAIAALSMAGIPPLNGFLSKEMMLEEAAHTVWAGQAWLLPALATLGALVSVAYSLRLIAHVFLGPVRGDYPFALHDPGVGLWFAPALLAGLVVLIGIAPMISTAWLVNASAGAVTAEVVAAKIVHWHGLEAAALWMSLFAVGAGLMALGGHPSLLRLWDRATRPDAKRMFDACLNGFARLARAFTDLLHDGALSRTLAVAMLTILAAGVVAFQGGAFSPGLRSVTPVGPVVFAGWLVLVAATVAIVLTHRNRLLALLLVGIIGLLVSAGFAYLSAPDLALTQVTVEVVTVMLLLLALNFLPRTTPTESLPSRRVRDAGIATLAGVGAGMLIHALMLRDFAAPSISAFHLANAKVLGGGTNVVNVILVDFRGYDTFGEIIVLGIAALVIFALTEVILASGPANDRLGMMHPYFGDAGDRHPLLLVIVARLILPLGLMVGVFVFLRGHNMPGGGFIAGLILGIAFLMQYMASGYGWTAARRRIDHHALIGSGVIVAGLTGVGSWAFGRPFLTSNFAYVNLPPLETFEVATAAIFDLGVFLTVLGAVMLALDSVSRLAVRSGERINSAPFDMPVGRGR